MNYNDKFAKFYAGRAWRRLRQVVLQEDDYMCQHCLRASILAVGNQVHHIVSLEADFTKALERANLITLCYDCHNIVHEKHSALVTFLNGLEL